MDPPWINGPEYAEELPISQTPEEIGLGIAGPCETEHYGHTRKAPCECLTCHITRAIHAERTQFATANADLAVMKKERDTARECAFNFMQLGKAAKSDLDLCNAAHARLGRELEEARADLLQLIAYAVSKCADAAVIKDTAKITGATGVVAIDRIASQLTAANARIAELTEFVFQVAHSQTNGDPALVATQMLAAFTHHTTTGGASDAG